MPSTTLGDFSAYQHIVLQHGGDKRDVPIYVGKAIPKGGRKGGKLDLTTGTVLYDSSWNTQNRSG